MNFNSLPHEKKVCNCGDAINRYVHIMMLCYMSETDIMLYINWTSIKINSNNIKVKMIQRVCLSFHLDHSFEKFDVR